MLAVVAGSYLILRRIMRSPFGMVLQSIRENEPRTRAIGYPVERYKIVAVMLSGLFAGLAGVLYAVQNRFAAPDFVYFLVSGETVIFNVMGGIGPWSARSSAPGSSCCCASCSAACSASSFPI